MRATGPILLDVSRLVSRLPRASLTGIDRVELAYLHHVLGLEGQVFGLVRAGSRDFLLDRIGLQFLADQLASPRTWSRPGLATRILVKRQKAGVVQSMADNAIGKRWRFGLSGLLRKYVAGGTYFNTGHSNLTERVFQAVAAAGLKRRVLVHDTLPLDVPQFMRPDTVPRFENRMRVVARFADEVIHPTRTVRASTEAQLARLGRTPPGIVAPLGVTVAEPEPLGFEMEGPFFLTVGTIEPRKNHAVLLEAWKALANELPSEALPKLVLAGSRGWHPPAFFARLEAHPLFGSHILERPGLSDGQLSTLYRSARALLFPSFAEGTGLPPLEAASAECPVIVADLPVYRETLGALPVYLDPVDMYLWKEKIKQYLAGSRAEAAISTYSPPTWDAHFKTVFS